MKNRKKPAKSSRSSVGQSSGFLIGQAGADSATAGQKRDKYDDSEPYQIGKIWSAVVKIQPKPVRTYFIQASGIGSVKIGRAVNVKQRLVELQCGSPVKLCLIGVIDGDCERDFHNTFSAMRLHGEWFWPDPPMRRAIEKLFGRVLELGNWEMASECFYETVYDRPTVAGVKQAHPSEIKKSRGLCGRGHGGMVRAHLRRGKRAGRAAHG